MHVIALALCRLYHHDEWDREFNPGATKESIVRAVKARTRPPVTEVSAGPVDVDGIIAAQEFATAAFQSSTGERFQAAVLLHPRGSAAMAAATKLAAELVRLYPTPLALGIVTQQHA